MLILKNNDTGSQPYLIIDNLAWFIKTVCCLFLYLEPSKITCIKFFIPVLSTSDLRRTGASSLRDFSTNPPRSSALSLPPTPTPPPLLMEEEGLGSSTPGCSDDTEGLRPSPPLECEAMPKAALVLTP